MKTAQEIYLEYKIMPNLQLHQLRVAAVAKIIAESFTDPIDTNSIISACLFHDMGNIIKSDFSRFPEFLQPEGLKYWQGVKDAYIKKYGVDEHLATEIIAKELGLPLETISCLKHTGFSNAIRNKNSNSFENKICNYADMRVGPNGVMSMDDRIQEGRERYKGRIHTIVGDNFEAQVQALKNIEKEIFGKINIRPDQITDDNIKEIIEELRNYKIKS
jgi:hypothetical protein